MEIMKYEWLHFSMSGISHFNFKHLVVSLYLLSVEREMDCIFKEQITKISPSFKRYNSYVLIVYQLKYGKNSAI